MDALPDVQVALGRALAGDTSEAARLLAEFGAAGFDAARGWIRFHVLAYFAEIAAILEDRSVAARLAAALRPHAGQLIGPAICPGPVDRFLGILAGIQASWAEAEAYFEGALALETRLSLPLLRARTNISYARMLLARDGAGDRSRADGLLTSALALAAPFDAGGLRADAGKLLDAV
jgi:hypothetical protein